MKIAKPLLLATALAAAIGSAYSIAAPGADGERHGKRFPIDLSVAEQRTAERFASIDTDDNEAISAAEFASHTSERKHRSGKGRKHKRDRSERGADLSAEQRAAFKAARAERKAAFEADLFSAMDQDGNGQLSANEASRENRKNSMRALKREKHFAKLDSNADGQLDRTEFSARLQRMVAADANGDGMLSRDEARTARKQRAGA